MTYHANVTGILKHAKAAAIAYHDLTGKPLGITGELGECIAAELLDLQLCTARTPGYDATDRDGRRIQIKCRRVLSARRHNSQRIGSMRFDHQCDAILLVLLDDRFEPTAIYEAPAAAVRPNLRSLVARRAICVAPYPSRPSSASPDASGRRSSVSHQNLGNALAPRLFPLPQHQ